MHRRTVVALSCVALAASFSSTVLGVGAPTVTLTLRHAPYYQMTLGRIAIRSTGNSECAATLFDQVTTVFTEGGVTVVDRENFAALVAEHKLNMSGLIDSATAAEMGKMLGVDALLEIRVTRCSTTDPGLIREHPKGLFGLPDTKRWIYARRVSGSLTGSVRIVDLKTGRIFKSQNLNIPGELRTSSGEGAPVPPDPNDVIDQMIGTARGAVHRMFFPWTERVTLHFFDDGDYNLKAAFNLFKAVQLEAALTQSKQSLEAADADPKKNTKALRHAVYNVGMCLYAMEQYDEAMPYFQRAATLDAGEYEPAALQQCQRAAGERKAYQEYEARATLANADDASARPAAPQPVPAPTPAAAPTQSPAERLKQLDGLLKQGLITKAEYDSMRAAILKELVVK